MQGLTSGAGGLQILADMKERKVPFNALTYSLLVEFHAAKGDAQAAVDALHEAQAAGIEIRNTSFEKLISRCERSGERQMMVCNPVEAQFIDNTLKLTNTFMLIMLAEILLSASSQSAWHACSSACRICRVLTQVIWSNGVLCSQAGAKGN